MTLAQMIPSLGFIGAGNMATAIIGAVAGRQLLKPHQIAACDAVAGKAGELSKKYGIRVAPAPLEIFETCEVVVLAVKPQNIDHVLKEIGPEVRQDHLLVSIVAGVRTSRIESELHPGSRVVRVMPNTPAMIGEGAAGVAGGSHATPEDVKKVIALFEAVGIAEEVSEDQLDAVTALSGSGPAYFFRFIEAMEEAGAEMGLDRALARRLAIQTCKGAAMLAAGSDDSPGELREKVTSPNGTTAAALEVMADRDLPGILKAAILRARDRSIELAG